MMHYLKLSPLILALVLLCSACSLDFIPVHFSRLNSAKNAKLPTKRGPNAPGAFTHQWKFERAGAFFYDPNRLAINKDGLSVLSGAARAGSGLSGDGLLLDTAKGIPYAALDGFSENATSAWRYQLSPDGSAWFFHNGKRWVSALPFLKFTNSAAEINQHIVYFHTEVAMGSLLVRVLGKPDQSGTLKSIDVRGVAPKMDNW